MENLKKLIKLCDEELITVSIKYSCSELLWSGGLDSIDTGFNRYFKRDSSIESLIERMTTFIEETNKERLAKHKKDNPEDYK